MPVIMRRRESQLRVSLALGLLFLFIGPFSQGIVAFGQLLKGSRISSDKSIQSTEQQQLTGGNMLNYGTKGSVDSILQNYELVPNRLIWRPHRFSEHSPFVLMHQRKSGGSSLRYTINKAVNNTGIASFIPCHNEVGCETFAVPVGEFFSIYALHIHWNALMRHLCEIANDKIMDNMARGMITATSLRSAPVHQHRPTKEESICNCSIQNHLPTLPPIQSNSSVPKDTPFSCLTNFREPVARLISCIYYRFDTYLLQRNLSCIDDLSVPRMTRLLIERLDKYNNSCLNEPYRVLGPNDDEKLVTSLGYDYDSNTFEVSPRLGELELTTLNATLHNLQRCVPVVLELPHSYRLLKTTFPSLHKMNAFDHNVREQTAHNFTTNCTAPSPAHMKVLRELTSFENVLYRAVVKKVHNALREFKLDGLAKHNNQSAFLQHRDHSN